MSNLYQIAIDGPAAAGPPVVAAIQRRLKRKLAVSDLQAGEEVAAFDDDDGVREGNRETV